LTPEAAIATYLGFAAPPLEAAAFEPEGSFSFWPICKRVQTMPGFAPRSADGETPTLDAITQSLSPRTTV
jgi:hypothetical protein